jgi:hypothetical protein
MSSATRPWSIEFSWRACGRRKVWGKETVRKKGGKGRRGKTHAHHPLQQGLDNRQTPQVQLFPPLRILWALLNLFPLFPLRRLLPPPRLLVHLLISLILVFLVFRRRLVLVWLAKLRVGGYEVGLAPQDLNDLDHNTHEVSLGGTLEEDVEAFGDERWRKGRVLEHLTYKSEKGS